MIIIWITVFLISLAYLFLIASYLIGWFKVGKSLPESTVRKVFCTVIIPVKNGEGTINFLINDLSKQTVKNSDFEIVVIDDNSDDDTFRNLNYLSGRIPNLTISKLKGAKGKKAALEYAISISKGELLLTLDADCRIKPAWLKSFIDYYISSNANLIIGPVTFIHNKKFFNIIQGLEFMSLSASAAGAAGIKRAVLSNAANMAFEKSLINELEDPFNRKFKSGDDIFLLQQTKLKYRDKIFFIKDKGALVYTYPASSLKDFIKQRTRWSSKSFGYNDNDLLITSLIIVFMNLSLFVLMVFSFINIEIFWAFLFLFGLKSVLDFIFLFPISDFYNYKKYVYWLFPMQFVYFIYVLFFAFAGLINQLIGKK